MSLQEDLSDDLSTKEERLSALVSKRTELAETEKLYAALYGGDDLQSLLKKYAPKLAKYGAMFGLPTGLLAGAADPGAFSGIFDAFGKVFGLFGLGG